MEELIKGEVKVAADGYRWVKVKSQPFIIADAITRIRSYSPFKDEPSLFIKLAEVEPTEEGILSFANVYGLLVSEPVDVGDAKAHFGCSLEDWRTAIVTMSHALSVWGALKERDEQKLKRWFSWEDQGGFINAVYSPDTKWPLGIRHTTAQILKQGAWVFGDSAGPDVGDIPMNERGAALAWLEANMRRNLSDHAYPFFHYQPDSERSVPLSLSLAPNDLLGVVWLQFARAIEGDLQYLRCRQCGKWFQVSAKARRSTTAFCSTRCRVNWHRNHPKSKKSKSKNPKRRK